MFSFFFDQTNKLVSTRFINFKTKYYHCKYFQIPRKRYKTLNHVEKIVLLLSTKFSSVNYNWQWCLPSSLDLIGLPYYMMLLILVSDSLLMVVIFTVPSQERLLLPRSPLLHPLKICTWLLKVKDITKKKTQQTNFPL